MELDTSVSVFVLFSMTYSDFLDNSTTWVDVLELTPYS